jgi:hypothetical protein
MIRQYGSGFVIDNSIVRHLDQGGGFTGIHGPVSEIQFGHQMLFSSDLNLLIIFVQPGQGNVCHSVFTVG